MANYANILAAITAAIYSNGNEEITGDVLQVVLKDMVNTLGNGYQFKGIATPATTPATPDAKIWYIGTTGTYENFGASPNAPFVVADGQIGIFRWDSTWHREVLPITDSVEIVDNLVDGGTDKALSAEMGKKLKEMIGDFEGREDVDISSITSSRCSLGTTTWFFENTQSHKAVPVTPGEMVYLKLSTYNGMTAGDHTGWFVFVTDSYDPPYANGDSIPATGSDPRIGALLGQTYELTVPINAAFLIITTVDGGGGACGWKVAKATGENESASDAVSDLRDRVDVLDVQVNGAPESKIAGWSDWRLRDASPNRYWKLSTDNAVEGGIVTVRLSDYSIYKVGVVVQDGSSYESTPISDTGWMTSDITKAISSSENGYRIRVTIARRDNTNMSPAEAATAVTLLEYVYVAGAGGLSGKISDIEGELDPPSRIPIVNNGTFAYVGRKIDLTTHTYTTETLGTVTSGGAARQGAAIFGNYLFQCHNNNGAITVFRLDTGDNVQVLSLSPNPSNHANSASFGQYYDSSDYFPVLYVSSEGEKKLYGYRITGREGNFSIALIQTISVSSPYYYANVHVDAPNNRGVVVGYAANSWQDGTGNNMVCSCFDMPSPVAGDVTILKLYNEFTFPFLYAAQGAVARYGKLYAAFGNTSEGLRIGGVVVLDYVLKNQESFIDLGAAGNFEPESCGIWDESLIVTTQDGAVIKITV